MKSKKKPPQESPYNVFRDWVVNSNPEAILPDWVVMSLNPRSILSMFVNCKDITIYLNNQFNSFNVMSLNCLEFCKFIKTIVIKHKITKWDLTYLKHEKQDKNLTQIHKYFPMLKRHEVENFLEYVKGDKEYDKLCEMLEIVNVTKKKRLTETDRDKIYKPISMKDWMKNFKVK